MSDSLISVFFVPLTKSGVTTIDVIIFFVILFSSIIIAKIISINVKRRISDKIPISDRETVGKIISMIIIAVGFLVALPYIKVDLSGIFVAGGLLAIIIGIAGQSLFSNVISGVILFFERPIKIGDIIGVGNVTGTVENIQILSTVIKTYDGIFTRIPNQTMFTSEIENYVAHAARRFEYTVGIRYEDDADAAIKIIKGVVSRHPFALKNPEPTVYVDKLDESSVNICVRVWAPSLVWWDVRMELLWKIKLALEDGGIQIPFPQRTLWFADEAKCSLSGEKSR
ncbi:small-conductance mechanosensitive channel [Methanomicrobium sp. W14]|uniref:mechanosensitive ion channel family protein n=1 Tax=Methanomicrobium sp. W14 TaxID=2817839 RepID=UPI001AE5EFEB|nr:mechanosensitive ion channel family protein [Methanomicrobium sp. W14]MBP2133241.1 small-conductance mechanosensitive channel [Methanomicrobium sp. W14]